MPRRKMVIAAIIALAALAAGAGVRRYAMSRPLSFDSEQWKAADKRHGTLRYRMAPNVAQLAVSERWDWAGMVQRLGPPDDNGAPHSACYLVGEPPSILPASTFYMRITFDDGGRIAYATIQAQ